MRSIFISTNSEKSRRFKTKEKPPQETHEQYAIYTNIGYFSSGLWFTICIFSFPMRIFSIFIFAINYVVDMVSGRKRTGVKTEGNQKTKQLYNKLTDRKQVNKPPLHENILTRHGFVRTFSFQLINIFCVRFASYF